jgi:hypothetical protein
MSGQRLPIMWTSPSKRLVNGMGRGAFFITLDTLQFVDVGCDNNVLYGFLFTAQHDNTIRNKKDVE